MTASDKRCGELGSTPKENVRVHIEHKDELQCNYCPSLLNPPIPDVVPGHVRKTQTAKSTSSNGSYHIYAMPTQTVTLSNTSSNEHYEFDDNLPHPFQPYELEPESPHYTEPVDQTATLPSQYEIPVSALSSTLPSSQVCVCVCAAASQFSLPVCYEVLPTSYH